MVGDPSQLLGGIKLNGANVVSEPVPHPPHYMEERGKLYTTKPGVRLIVFDLRFSLHFNPLKPPVDCELTERMKHCRKHFSYTYLCFSFNLTSPE